jgi:hypothetical protein
LAVTRTVQLPKSGDFYESDPKLPAEHKKHFFHIFEKLKNSS